MRPNGSSSTCCLQANGYWLFSRKAGSCWNVTSIDTNGLRLADLGKRTARSSCERTAIPRANPKTRWPRGMAGPSSRQKVAELYTRPSKKVHRKRVVTTVTITGPRLGLEPPLVHYISSTRTASGDIRESSKTALTDTCHGCCGAFRRTHGTLTPLILRVRRMCL